MLECVVNLSEGRDRPTIDHMARAAGSALLDVHSDPHHNRSVLTLAGTSAIRSVARVAVASIDLRTHAGAHPRLGVVDVVPFVPLGSTTLAEAVAARDEFARWAADELALPCFLYGPQRSLPELRRGAFSSMAPDTGPLSPHPSAGSCAVGARPVLVAYNLWLAEPDIADARRIASAVRGPAVRALGLDIGGQAQVSMNLIDPESLGPADVYDRVGAMATIARAELVGLVPESVLHAVDPARWPELNLAEDSTIESRLRSRGLSEP